MLNGPAVDWGLMDELDYEPEISRSSEVRLSNLVRASLALVLLYVAATFGPEAEVCAEEAGRCGVTPLWEGMLVVDATLLFCFAAVSLIYAASLARSWEQIAHRIGSYIPPAVVLTLFACGVMVATAPYR